MAEERSAATRAAVSTLFISYAHADRAVVDQLIADLQAHEIRCWIDKQDLKPGTPSWEQALRSAIRGADGVVLLCSPSALASRYVPDELRIAEMYQRTVYPFWVAGEHWMDSVPMGWGGAQNLDARGDGYPQALAALVAHVRAQSMPPEQQPGVTAPTAPPRNPYKGLRPFRGVDAGDFFGRERVVQDLLDTLGATLGSGPRYLAVVGPSGSGKSSVVLAGLLPRLHGGALAGSASWRYLEPMTPGAHPLEALTVALSSAIPGSSLSALRADLDASPRGLHLLARRLAQGAEGRVLLVIDQFEELFTLTASDDERQHFIDLLVTAVREPGGPLLAVLTLRADFYDRPMTYPELVTLMDAHSKLIPPMDLEDLRAAITRPAALPDVQVRFEGDLVGDLLFEVRGQPGALPLLQFTLDQLFERRQGRLLTLAAYRELGGVRGALSRRADATYAALPTEEHRLLARALFLRLIEPGASEQEATRRRAPLHELALADARQAAVMREVIASFVDARLLSADQVAGTRTVEVSHEALIREWPRLTDWLREAREDIRLQQALSEDAASWLRHDRSPDYLYRGTLLAEARDWLERNVPSADEQAFVAASMAEAAREVALAQEQQARELAMARQAAVASRRAAHRLRYLVGVLGAFLVVAALLSAIALQQQSRATANEHAAVRNERAARAAQATAVAERNAAISSQLTQEANSLLGSHYDLALLLGLEATRFHDTLPARGAVLAALLQPSGLLATLSGQTRVVESVAFSPDGRLLATGNADGTIRLWDVAGRRQVGQLFIGQDDTVFSVAFSPDGKLLASGSWDGAIRLWDVATRRQVGPPLTSHTGMVNTMAYGPIASVAFSPRGTMLAASGTDGVVRLWSVAGHRQVGQLLSGDHAAILHVAFSPGGTLLAAGSGDGSVHVWDVASGRQIGQFLAGQTGTYGSVAFSPDGALLAAGGADGGVRLWGVATHHLVGQALTGPNGPISGVSFNPRGTTLAAGSDSGAIWLWDVASRRAFTVINGQFGSMNSIAWSPDGALLAAGGDVAVRLWELKSEQRIGPPLTGPRDIVYSVAFSPGGKLLAASSGDDTIWLWDVATRRQSGRPLTAPFLSDIAFSPSGALLAVNSGGPIELWDVAGRRQIGQINGAGADITFSPDGKLLASGIANGPIQLWDVATRRPMGPPLTGHTGAVNSLAFSPDGRILASGSADSTIRLWDVATRRQIGQPLVGAAGAINSVAFSPDGRLLAAGGDDGTIQIWDVASDSLVGQPLAAHTGGVTSLAFSPDGRVLASAGRDRTIRLWDVAGGSELGEPITGLPAIVTSIAFSPDGALLASGSAEPEPDVRLWPVAPRDLPARACAIAGRNLTRQEWQQYLGAMPYEKTCPSWP